MSHPTKRPADEHPVMDISTGRRRRTLGVLACAGAIAVVAIVKSQSSLSPVELLTQIDAAASVGNDAEADRLSQQLIDQAPESDEACIVNARLAANRGKLETALEYHRRLTDYSGAWAEEVLNQRAELLLETGRLLDAESCLRNLLKRKPNSIDYHRRLFDVVRISGRNWELQPLLFQLLRRDHADPRKLMACAAPEQSHFGKDDSKFRRAALDRRDPLGLLSSALSFLFENDRRRALPLLREAVDKEPLCLEAQARLGLALLDTESADKFLDWHLQLPAAADGFPSIWYVRGLWMQKKSFPEQAAYCFLRSLGLDANHRACNLGMANTLQSLKLEKEAAFFSERARRLAKLATLAAQVQDTPDRYSALIAALEQLGRLHEAQAWCKIAIERGTKDPAQSARLCLERISERVEKGGLLFVDPTNPAPDLGLSDFDAPNWREILPRSAPAIPPRGDLN